MRIRSLTARLATLAFLIGIFEYCHSEARAQDNQCISAIRTVSDNLPSSSIEYNPPINNYYLEGNPYVQSDVIRILFNDNSAGRTAMSDNRTLSGWSEYLILSCSQVVMVQAGVRATDWVNFFVWNAGRVRQRECIFTGGRPTPEQNRQWESNKWLYYFCPG